MNLLAYIYPQKQNRVFIKYNFIFNLINSFSITFYGESSEEKTTRHAEEDAKANYEKAMRKLKRFTGQYKQRYGEATGNIDELLSQSPQLDLSNFLRSLSGISEDISGYEGDLSGVSRSLGEIGGELSDIGRKSGTNVNKYLSKGDDYISSMLDEALGGANKSLAQSKKLARTEMPGLSLFKDQQGSNLASAMQQLKSMGGATPQSMSSLLSGSQQAKANIALEASRYRTQTQRDLGNAYMQTGQAKANAYAGAFGMGQSQANLAQSQGMFQANIAGQRANIAGQQANIAGQQANMANQRADITGRGAAMGQTEFVFNQMTPWERGLQWEQQQAIINDPLQYQSNLWASSAGMNWAGMQTYLGMQMQASQNQTQNALNTAAIIGDLANTYAQNSNNDG